MLIAGLDDDYDRGPGGIGGWYVMCNLRLEYFLIVFDLFP